MGNLFLPNIKLIIQLSKQEIYYKYFIYKYIKKDSNISVEVLRLLLGSPFLIFINDNELIIVLIEYRYA